MGEPARSFPKAQSSAPEAAVERRKSTLREYAEALLVALALALIIRTFFIQAYKIPSGSMEPTLLVGDHILVNKISYGLRLPDSLLGFQIPGFPHGRYVMDLGRPERGDVIVFVYPEDRSKDFIKRIVGLPGETVEVRDGVVYVNGRRLDDPHAHLSPAGDRPSNAYLRGRNFGPVTVPPGKLFVMGDNRDESHDSRFWGYVDIDDVEGKALFVYWSWDGDSSGPIPVRWTRFGKRVE